MRAVLILAFVLCLPACHLLEPIDPERHAALEREVQDARDKLEGITNNPDVDDATRDQAAKWQADLDRLLAQLDAAKGPDGEYTVESVSTSASMLLPPPWNIIGLVGIPLAIGLAQQIRVKKQEKATRSVVNSIDALRIKAPQVNQYFREHAAEMQQYLTDDAKRIVHDESMV